MTNPSPGGTPDPYQPADAPNPQQQSGSTEPHQSPLTSGEPGQPVGPYGAPLSGYPGGVQPGYPPSYPPPGYQAPGYPPAAGYPAYAPPTAGTNAYAVLAMIFAFVFAPAGIVCGHIALKQIKETGEGGEQLATWGLVLSYVFTGISVLACCGVFGLWALMLPYASYAGY